MRRVIVSTLAIWIVFAAETAEAGCPVVPENPVWDNVFHDTGVWLRGAELEKYVNDVRARLAATRCLAEAQLAMDVPGEAVAGSVPAEGP